MSRIYHHPSLLTINGSCKTLSGKPQRLKITSWKNSKTIKKVRNFIMFTLPGGINLMVFNRGQFKLTIKNSEQFFKLIQNLDHLIDQMWDILQVLYTQVIYDITCKISQLVSTLSCKFPVEEHFQLNYFKLIKRYSAIGTHLKWSIKNYTFAHQINWELFETGTSSIFFCMSKRNQKIADFKLYVNLKIVIFSYKIEEISYISKIIPEFITSYILPQNTNT
jgi:hypothetical protein